MPDSEEAVVFYLPDGTEVSNDPRWKAKEFANQLEQQNAVWQAQAQAAARQEAKRFSEKESGQAEEESDEVEEDDSSDHSESEFAGLTVAQLKREAAERDINLKKAGVRTKTELIAVLEEHDASQK